MITFGELLPTLVTAYGATEWAIGGNGRAYRVALDDGRYVLIAEQDANNLPPANDIAVDIAVCAADGEVLDESHPCDVDVIEDAIFHLNEEGRTK